jgi:hypothetical protein
VDDWIASARLPHACEFPVAGAIEAVFERVAIRVEERTAPYTVVGSVCQYFSSSDLWFGNLHAFPPAASFEDLRAAALDLRGGTWSAATYEGRDYLHSHDSLLVAHDRATLWVITPGMASPFEDIDRLAAAIFEAMDAPD